MIMCKKKKLIRKGLLLWSLTVNTLWCYQTEVIGHKHPRKRLEAAWFTNGLERCQWHLTIHWRGWHVREQNCWFPPIQARGWKKQGSQFRKSFILQQVCPAKIGLIPLHICTIFLIPSEHSKHITCRLQEVRLAWKCVALHGPLRSTLGLCDLDAGLLGDAQQGDVGYADEGPLLTGPEQDDGALLRCLGRRVEVGEAHAAQVGRQADQNVPARSRRGKSAGQWPRLTACRSILTHGI